MDEIFFIFEYFFIPLQGIVRTTNYQTIHKMKKLTKLILSVAVLGASFACTTDATDDLGIKLDSASQSQIVLSLEESRTQLGEKVDGVYPLYWSEGDKIAVNGVASHEVPAESVGTPSATFTIDSATYPYNIVYPAPAEGVAAVAEGCYPVVFPTTQLYKAGNIDGNAAVMYGYAEEGSLPTLHHLSGVLRFAVKGEATIASIVIKSQSGAIAGTYDVNCASGALTAQEGKGSNTITMSFGKGLALGSEATPIYVAMPAGEHGDVSATLTTTTNEQMAVVFNTDGNKAIKAGIVREFGEFTFVENVGVGDEFVIDSKEALIAFAADPTKSAIVTANIDMTGEAWSPIDGFSHKFDGGNFEIKGLSAPLFNNTNGTIKNVKLVNVNISSNGHMIIGAIANNLFAESDKSGFISNCSVSGTITINNSASILAANYPSTYEVAHFGGLVGSLHGATVSNCVNEANIQVNAVAKTDNAVVIHPFVGGVVGCASTATLGEGAIYSTVTNCENKGAINYHDGATKQVLVPHIGGVVGGTTKDNYGTVSDCVNRGAIDFNAISGMIDTSLGIDGGMSMGGIIGSSYGVMENNNNYGKLTISGGKPKAIHMGGVAGTITPIKFHNNHNHTSGTLTVDKSVLSWSINVAGLVAEYTNNGSVEDESVENCTNDGAVEVHASTDPAMVAGTYYYRVAGLTCYQNFTMRNCENKANGDITVSGDVILGRKNTQPCYGVSGALAYMTTNSYPYNVVNRGDVNVYTNVSVLEGVTDPEHCRLDISGCGGYITRNFQEQVANYGNITIGKPDVEQTIKANGIFIGGVVAHASSVNCSSINEGNITIHNKVSLISGKNIFISTMHAYLSGTIGTGSTNKGNLVCNGTYTAASDGASYIGGVAGSVNGGTVAMVTNEGDVTYNASSTTPTYIAGAIGHVGVACKLSDVSNSGVVNITKDAKNTGLSYIGGAIGYIAKASTLTRVSNSTKSGVQYGVIFSRQASKTGSSCDLRIGGVVGRMSGVLTTAESVTNSAGIHVDGYQLGTSGLSIGGVAGMLSNDAHVLGGLVQNSGEILYEGRCPKSNFGFGGCIATLGSKAKSCENIVNTGDIIVKKAYADSYPTGTAKKSMQIGGIIAYVQESIAFSNARCYCDMYMDQVPSVREVEGTVYTNSFGMITGSPHMSAITNSHCGGRIYDEYDIENEKYIGKTLNAENYFKYICSVPVTAEEAKAANCGYISSIDATPTFSSK